jgi:hypothetical protein
LLNNTLFPKRLENIIFQNTIFTVITQAPFLGEESHPCPWFRDIEKRAPSSGRGYLNCDEKNITALNVKFFTGNPSYLGGLQFEARQKVSETTSQQKSCMWWYTPVIPAPWEA